ncbi:MAG: FHA domain-containing protein [Plesiomonas shigelloides]
MSDKESVFLITIEDEEGKTHSREIRSTLDRITIGRDPACTLRVQNAYVSKTHCTLTRITPDQWQLIDGSGVQLSASGIRYEGRLIDGSMLIVPDRPIELLTAPVKLTLRLVGPPEFIGNRDLTLSGDRGDSVALAQIQENVKHLRSTTEPIPDLLVKLVDRVNRLETAHSVSTLTDEDLHGQIAHLRQRSVFALKRLDRKLKFVALLVVVMALWNIFQGDTEFVKTAVNSAGAIVALASIVRDEMKDEYRKSDDEQDPIARS